MKLHVNGEVYETTQDVTIQRLMDELEIDTNQGGVALALNDEIVPKERWKSVKVTENDRLEIIHAVQGG